jgi:hypothetical protein
MLASETLQEELKWLGTPVHNYTGSVENIRQHIPKFDRVPFSTPGKHNPSENADNAYLDMIVRKPSGAMKNEIPIGVVSKNYQLVSHIEVFNKILEAIKATGIAIERVKADLTISEYGERMGLQIELPESFQINPGDGHKLALRIGCFNSVDGSTRFRIVLGWFRFICSNGMVVGSALNDYKRRHNQTLHIDDIMNVIDQGIELAVADSESLSKWVETPFEIDQLTHWVDGAVMNRWGVKAATRIYHIVMTGKDVEIVPFAEKTSPSMKEIRTGNTVQGSSAPANNLYAVSQALTWIAGQRHEIEEQLAWQRDVPALMRELARPPH